MRNAGLYYYLMFLMLVGILNSCEEKAEWNINNQNMDTIVVTGVLTNELRNQYVVITRLYIEPNEIPEPVTGAIVILKAGQDSTLLIETPELPGYYFTEAPLAAVINREYRIWIKDGEKIYTAQTGMQPVTPANIPSFIKDSQTGLYRIAWNNSAYNPLETAMFEALINWEHLVDPEITDTIKNARMMHYTLKTIDVSYNIFPQSAETVWFPEGSYAIVKKYSVTEEYGNYLRALLAETAWQGSLFEEARGNLPGNISNGGLGFFTACSVIGDTLVVE